MTNPGSSPLLLMIVNKRLRSLSTLVQILTNSFVPFRFPTVPSRPTTGTLLCISFPTWIFPNEGYAETQAYIENNFLLLLPCHIPEPSLEKNPTTIRNIFQTLLTTRSPLLWAISFLCKTLSILLLAICKGFLLTISDSLSDISWPIRHR